MTKKTKSERRKLEEALKDINKKTDKQTPKEWDSEEKASGEPRREKTWLKQ